MDNFAHKDATRTIGKPRDWNAEKDGDCSPLPVQDIDVDGIGFIRSWWRPSPSEMEALDNGGAIALDIAGPVHPVIRLGVEGAAPVSIESASRRIAINVGAAVEAMLEQARQTSPGSYLAVSPCQVDPTGVSMRWGMCGDPANVAPDFAHWTMIGPIGAEGIPMPDLPDISGLFDPDAGSD